MTSATGSQRGRAGGRLALWAALFVLAGTAAAGRPARAESALTLDFERGGLSDDWSGGQRISASRVEAPAAPEGAAGPAGMGLAVSTEGGGGLFLKAGRGPKDWTACEAVSFWVHRSPAEADRRAASTMEVQIYEADGGARFWRKVDLDHTGWKRFTLPLKWFRWGAGRVPRWDRADRLGFWFRDGAEVVLDSVTVDRGAGKRPSELSAADVRGVAFPGVDAAAVTVVETPDVRLLTDAADLDADRLAEHLSTVAARVRGDLSVPRPAVAPILVVFATDRAYRAFPPRLATKLNSVAGEPGAGGYALHGIAASAWDPRRGTLRPVYTHEFVHGLVARTVGVPNSQEWFQEGLANYYQTQFHPQANLGEIVRDGLADPARRTPLKTLCGGAPIPGTRYWQALTVIDLFLNDDRYARRLPALLKAFGETGKTDLGPHLGPVFDTDWPALTADWTRHCERLAETAGEEAR